MELLLEFMKASLGPAVAALGVAVAVGQWQTNQVKLRLDAYDRRLIVYKSVINLLDEVVAEVYARRGHPAHAGLDRPQKAYKEVSPDVLAAFQSALLEAPFLFDDEVSYFMGRVEDTRRSIRRYAIYLEGESSKSAKGTSKELSLRELRESEKRIKGSRERAYRLFAPYLKLAKPRGRA